MNPREDMHMQTTTISSTTGRGDDYFDDFAAAVQRRAQTMRSRPVFTTKTPDLYAVFLAAFPDHARQVHTCNACRHFLHRYGGLVAIEPDGSTVPLLWGSPGLPEPYAAVDAALSEAVARSEVDSAFLAGESLLGVGQTGAWRHFKVTWTQYGSPLHTAGQMMAEKREDYAMLQRALSAYSLEHLQKAHALLDSDALYRSEKTLGVASWLLDLRTRRIATPNLRRRDAMTWAAVAAAPAGFCHVKASMIGTLLDDLAAGLPYDAVRRRFAEKMHPLKYQRPQAPPSVGNIAQAEQIVGKLKTAGALARRFARLDDLRPLWTFKLAAPTPAEGKPGGIFAHLMPEQVKGPLDAGAPPQVMTWEKFAARVLPTADRIECYVPMERAPFIAFVTAGDAAAPPMLQWDRAEERNPVSWYVYNGGALAHDWHLTSGTYCNVAAVTLSPPHWNGQVAPQHFNMAVFVLDGCRDLCHVAGGGMFPESLKADYHPIRRTIEAHMQRAPIAGKEEATACGLALQQPAKQWGYVFRVTAGGVRSLYKLDRWD
jgi:hypothetical protein